ncbi:MAG: serine/threonine protein kinase [Agriterribacter sp.]
MADTSHIFFRADDRSFYSLLKKDIHKFCIDNGVPESRINNVDIVIAELTSNLQKHAIGGNIMIKIGDDKAQRYVEIICFDDGPGISDLSRVMADGYSSVNTMGHGLGSIRRMSDYFDIFSLRNWGTVMVTRLFINKETTSQRSIAEFRGINIPKTGESVSGDGYSFQEIPTGFKIILADGLGHGVDANIATQAAVQAFLNNNTNSPMEMIRLIHASIRKTRGCVGTVIFYDKGKHEWRFAGVGNIVLKWHGEDVKTSPSYNGIIGHNIPTSINDSVLSAGEFPIMIACSDGIRSNWNISRFPQIVRNDGTVLATAIFKEFNRNTDDASVIVCKL